MDRYLAQAALGPASRRIYRISLASWAWPLVGRRTPPGACRRRVTPPMVPLTLLDDAAAGPRIQAALRERAAATDARTVNRELSALRGAVGWWQDRCWIKADPTAGLRHLPRPRPVQPPVPRERLEALFRAAPSLREQALWRVLHDSGAPAAEVLRLDVGALDLARHRGRRAGPGRPSWISWTPATTELLRWLTAGRTDGPVFLTGRRAPAGTAPADRCPVTGRGRLSYRRAAEILAAASRPLDPAGAGWTPHQLRNPAPALPADPG